MPASTYFTLFLFVPFASGTPVEKSIVTHFGDSHLLADAVTDWLYDPVTAEDKYGHISGWKTSGVDDMAYLFSNCRRFTPDHQCLEATDSTFSSNASTFNEDINSWDTSGVTSMEGMFSHAFQFNQPLNGWDTSNVEIMSGMFENAAAFNQPLDNWNTQSLWDMSDMFSFASSFNQDISNWDVTQVNATTFNKYWGNRARVEPLEHYTVEDVFIGTNLSNCTRFLIFESFGEQNPNLAAASLGDRPRGCEDSFPIWAIATIATGGGLLLVGAVTVAALFCKKCAAKSAASSVDV